MKRLLILALVGLVAACGARDNSAVYAHLGDRLKASSNGLFGWPCTKSVKGDPESLERVPDRDCYRFDPPARMSGVWIDEFEGSQFMPAGSTVPHDSERDFGTGTWLNTGETSAKFPGRDGNGPTDKAYAISFIGQRTSHAGNYGHMGASGSLVVVDTLLSIREVPRSKPGDVVR